VLKVQHDPQLDKMAHAKSDIAQRQEVLKKQGAARVSDLVVEVRSSVARVYLASADAPQAGFRG
jgi:hypothetical protein